MMKKEKFEQMKELGRGGLSKGLTILRNAAEKAAAASEAANERNAQSAAAYAAITNGAVDDASSTDAAAAAAAAGTDASSSASPASSNGSTPGRLTYDELVTLSMKLTRQNKMMKAQFQKIQTRITTLSVKEADANVLADFVQRVVGVDLDACHVVERKHDSTAADADDSASTAAASSSSSSGSATIDAQALVERYTIQRELLERDHRQLEAKLRAELAALQAASTASTAPRSNSSSTLNDALPLLPAPSGPATLHNYDEIDLRSEPLVQSSATFNDDVVVVARLEAQLADAHVALEQLRVELATADADAVQQRDALEQQWQLRWDDQSATLAALQNEQRAAAASDDDNARLSAEVARLNHTIVELDAAAVVTQAALDALRLENATLTQTRDVQNTAALQTQQDDDNARLHAEMTALEAAHAHAQTELVRLRDAAAAAAVPSVEPVDDNTASAAAAIERLTFEIETLTNENASLRMAQQSIASSSSSMEEATTDAGAADAVNDETTAAALLDELERVKMARAEVEHALRTTQDKLRSTESQLQAAQSEIEQNSSLLEALKTDTSRLVDQVAAAQRTVATQDATIATLTTTNASLEEELSVLRHDTQSNLEQTLDEVASTKQQVVAAELAAAQVESRMAEERAYLTSKLEKLIKDLDESTKQREQLEATVDDKNKHVAKMAASQAAITRELMELQATSNAMRQDLHMAAEGLEAHALRAEQSERARVEAERTTALLLEQLDELRRDKDVEVERLQTAQRVADAAQQQLQATCDALERTVRDEQQRVVDLDAIVAQQTTTIGHLSVDLAETKKALSDRMGFATRLQTENMGMAAKQAEQAALIEHALRDAATSRDRADAITVRMQDAAAELQRAVAARDDALAAMQQLRTDVAAQGVALETEKQRLAAQTDAAIAAVRESSRRDVERIEADSKHKSKLALTAVLEKEAEIQRLSHRLAELEEDVRSGDADHRTIVQVAQLQAKREAESRAQALALQDMTLQLRDAQQLIRQLQHEKQAHDEELVALMQTQRRDGVNLEYLKNVVVQYMSFRPGSSQQVRLVPVLSTLLQFTAHDLQEIKHATSTRRSSWASWGGLDASGAKANTAKAGAKKSDYKPIVAGPSSSSSSAMMPPSSSRSSSFPLPLVLESSSSGADAAVEDETTSESHDF